MNNFIPLMVIVPLICAILINLFSKSNKLVKGLALVVAIVIPCFAVAFTP